MNSRKRTYSSTTKKTPNKKGRSKIATVHKLYPGIPKPMTQPKVELKTMDVPLIQLTFQNVDTVMNTAANPGCALLNATKEGTGVSQRVGRKINMKSVQINGTIEWIDEIQLGLQNCRLIMVLDKQSNGSLPSIQNLLADTDFNLTQTTSWLSKLNIANSDRFTILMDQSWYFPQRGDGQANPLSGAQWSNINRAQDHRVNSYIKLKGAEVRYNGTDNAPSINQIVSGSIFLVALSDVELGESSFRAHLKSRIRYWDA